ncbi:ABC transporter ATP-binding protein [Planococcus sp. 1R117A]|uniref:ABC transporter ATP-binding protein n=1 Tax=Planococcus sp. 1R117A TaxID=3447020 RepID=UPI003EDC4CC9
MFVSIENLCFSYSHTKTAALDKFSLHIEKGEVISILGRSGSGKSTILRLLAGLEKPSAGKVAIKDQILVDDQIFLQPEKRGIGMVFQDYALFPHMTVAENILFGLFRLKRPEKKKRLQEVMELVELQGYEKRYPHQLSGGQQQRVAIARALAPNPHLLLLDEPFSNLDAELQEKIRKDLRDLLKKADITSIFVTHDEKDAHILADRIVKIRDGCTDFIGRPCDLLDVYRQEAKTAAKITESPELLRI